MWHFFPSLNDKTLDTWLILATLSSLLSISAAYILLYSKLSRDAKSSPTCPTDPALGNPFPFMALPPELRIQIYAHLIPSDTCIFLPSPPRNLPAVSLPALYSVNRGVRLETQRLFYGGNTFVLRVPGNGVERAVRWLRDVDEGALGAMRDFRVVVGGAADRDGRGGNDVAGRATGVNVEVLTPAEVLGRWKRHRVQVMGHTEDSGSDEDSAGEGDSGEEFVRAIEEVLKVVRRDGRSRDGGDGYAEVLQRKHVARVLRVVLRGWGSGRGLKRGWMEWVKEFFGGTNRKNEAWRLLQELCED